MRSIHGVHLDKEQYTLRRGYHQKGAFGHRYLPSGKLVGVCQPTVSLWVFHIQENGKIPSTKSHFFKFGMFWISLTGKL